MKCKIRYIGQLGSKPYHHILNCSTHSRNFFSKEEKPSVCDKAAKQGAPDFGYCGCTFFGVEAVGNNCDRCERKIVGYTSNKKD